ncbi:acyl-CoA N-acyltransferase [Truncatella angustata]|uniref:Acyl-CoA N-acyltransferase n=1 Tax=Truncatella angustata TaxID=152316 RepID=A0A9P8RQ47_9PEZI|nr:acyl-CoA N-acyltransferase [Truncatella angustata]KAH6647291.1 acyl-CoA N-acyltransferase [Truncatella angustata]
MPTYKIERCTVEDSAGVARNNMSAFWTDSTWRLVWPEDRTLEEVIEACALRWPNTVLTDRVHKRHLKAVEVETGTVVGYIRFLLPDRLSGEWLDAQPPDVTAEQRKQFDKQTASANWTFRSHAEDIDEPLEPILAKYRSRDYMELEFLAVQPAYRGQGIATLLMEASLAESDRLGIDVFMVAYKAGLGVYKRMGFEILESLIIDDTPWGGQGEYANYFMERKARKQH